MPSRDAELAADPVDDLADLGGAAGGPANPPETPRRGLWVRATIHLQGLRRDHIAYVNPDDPQVDEALTHLWIVPLPGQEIIG